MVPGPGSSGASFRLLVAGCMPIVSSSSRSGTPVCLLDRVSLSNYLQQEQGGREGPGCSLSADIQS